MSSYRIVESVGSRVEPVHSYEDLEIHHPSQHGQEAGRAYATVDGHREEVLGRRGEALRSEGGHVYVSKDFVLQDSDSRSALVPVPAPIAGVIGRVDRASGLVSIHDRPGGEMIAQIRHMDLRQSTLKAGDTVEYGQQLGLQGGFGGGNPHRYGTHVHIDMNQRHIEQFRTYIQDLDTGVLTPGKRTASRAVPSDPISDGLLGQGEHGLSVRLLQESLTKLGYRDAHGRGLQADSHFGARTEEALRSFQKDHGLTVDGIAGPVTLRAIKQAERAPLLTDACHPDHALFKQAQACVHQLDAKHKRAPDHLSDQLSGALVVEAKREGFKRIDEVILGVDGKNVFAKESATLAVFDKYVHVDTVTGLNQSIARSGEQLEKLEQVKCEQAIHAAQQERQRQQAPERGHGRAH